MMSTRRRNVENLLGDDGPASCGADIALTVHHPLPAARTVHHTPHIQTLYDSLVWAVISSWPGEWARAPSSSDTRTCSSRISARYSRSSPVSGMSHGCSPVGFRTQSWPLRAVSDCLVLSAAQSAENDGEIRLTPVYALLNVVSGYHDSLLSKHLDPALSLPPHPFAAPEHPGPSSSSTSTPTLPGASGRDPSAAPAAPKRTTPTLPPPSDHARYTKYWTARSGVYRKASRMLVTIGYIELLVEMVAKKKLGDRRRWNFVLGMEGIK